VTNFDYWLVYHWRWVWRRFRAGVIAASLASQGRNGWRRYYGRHLRPAAGIPKKLFRLRGTLCQKGDFVRHARRIGWELPKRLNLMRRRSLATKIRENRALKLQFIRSLNAITPCVDVLHWARKLASIEHTIQLEAHTVTAKGDPNRHKAGGPFVPDSQAVNMRLPLTKVFS